MTAPQDPAKRLFAALMKWGPSSSSELCNYLNTPSSTLQRLLKSVSEAEPSPLLNVGKSRARRYALKRPVDGLPAPTPIYEGAPDGSFTQIMTLQPVEPQGYYLHSELPDLSSGFLHTDPRYIGPNPFSDLPWFLENLRPEGFLGRAWVSDYKKNSPSAARVSFPSDLQRWSGEDILRFTHLYGSDNSGSLVIGAPMLRYLQYHSPPSIPAHKRAQIFPQRAAEALSSAPYGSSPGGEQPKFSLAIDHHPAIIKFSPPMSTPSGRRWADLLYSEYIVSEVLRRRNIPASASELLDSEDRRFLQVRRFDRSWTGARTGRRGMCSLFSFDRDGAGRELRSWRVITEPLIGHGLTPEDHAHVCWLESLGHLIANSDMHPGNLSLFLNGTQISGVAPVYDMLPMAFAPSRAGEIPNEAVDPRAHQGEFMPSVCEVALEIWDEILRGDLSPSYRRLAEAQRDSVRSISG